MDPGPGLVFQKAADIGKQSFFAGICCLLSSWPRSFSGALGERTRGARFFLSISHDGGIAAAVCVMETDTD